MQKEQQNAKKNYFRASYQYFVLVLNTSKRILNALLFCQKRFFPRPIRLRISRPRIHFFIIFSSDFCLTRAYNFCHQVVLVDVPMTRTMTTTRTTILLIFGIKQRLGIFAELSETKKLCEVNKPLRSNQLCQAPIRVFNSSQPY